MKSKPETPRNLRGDTNKKKVEYLVSYLSNVWCLVYANVRLVVIFASNKTVLSLLLIHMQF